jgi:hypothetical protein
VCAELVVKVGDRTFVRNRHHLIQLEEPVDKDTPEMESSTGQQESTENTPTQTSVHHPAETCTSKCWNT